jgi:hypothetical protein
MGVVEPAQGQVVADGKQVPWLVVQHPEIHGRRQRRRAIGEGCSSYHLPLTKPGEVRWGANPKDRGS